MQTDVRWPKQLPAAQRGASWRRMGMQKRKQLAAGKTKFSVTGDYREQRSNSRSTPGPAVCPHARYTLVIWLNGHGPGGNRLGWTDGVWRGRAGEGEGAPPPPPSPPPPPPARTRGGAPSPAAPRPGERPRPRARGSRGRRALGGCWGGSVFEAAWGGGVRGVFFSFFPSCFLPSLLLPSLFLSSSLPSLLSLSLFFLEHFKTRQEIARGAEEGSEKVACPVFKKKSFCNWCRKAVCRCMLLYLSPGKKVGACSCEGEFSFLFSPKHFLKTLLIYLTSQIKALFSSKFVLPVHVNALPTRKGQKHVIQK